MPPSARKDDEPFDYWAWEKTAPHCEGCGYAFDPKDAPLCGSPNPQRWCCATCSRTKTDQETTQRRRG